MGGTRWSPAGTVTAATALDHRHAADHASERCNLNDEQYNQGRINGKGYQHHHERRAQVHQHDQIAVNNAKVHIEVLFPYPQVVQMPCRINCSTEVSSTIKSLLLNSSLYTIITLSQSKPPTREVFIVTNQMNQMNAHNSSQPRHHHINHQHQHNPAHHIPLSYAQTTNPAHHPFHPLGQRFQSLHGTISLTKALGNPYLLRHWLTTYQMTHLSPTTKDGDDGAITIYAMATIKRDAKAASVYAQTVRKKDTRPNTAPSLHQPHKRLLIL